jgi:hypothetical protein
MNPVKGSTPGKGTGSSPTRAKVEARPGNVSAASVALVKASLPRFTKGA